MVTTDLPTTEEFEDAKEAIENDEPELAPHFAYWHHVDEFGEYSTFMAYVAANKASRSAQSASAAESAFDGYERAAKGLLLGIGAAALIEAVIGDARL
ncbi:MULTISPECIES: hypothetical protein [Halorubrum]|uniref:Uncharacterized protein n=1 Tax=Halorubrum ruber TaxID=2982524 RepID=A0A8T8LP95_9EURY|nr:MULTISPECIES: hypothetical protein [Halorubrum]QUO49102.1 hypothetical protein J7656_07155 [Halorubrum ruber]